ncbi:MAG: M23 family metallopeptidase [Lachnospiraceae bacterium]|nr:M23 family metallopeptidase [Lachnospiraceae bacterium]
MEKEKKKLTEKQLIHVLVACVAVMLICVVVMFIYIVNLVNDNKALQNEILEMHEQYELEKKELSEKVTLLSNQLAVWIEAEEAQAQKQVPSGLPVSGKVITIESEPIIIATEIEGNNQENAEAGVTEEEDTATDANDENAEIDENIVEQEIPTVVFGVKKETQIVAAGAGVVKSVEEGTDGTHVMIDHGNGYVSVYLFKGTPKVKTGDEVLRGTLLFEVTSNNAKFSFQILENGNYVNPMDLMEIHG